MNSELTDIESYVFGAIAAVAALATALFPLYLFLVLVVTLLDLPLSLPHPSVGFAICATILVGLHFAAWLVLGFAADDLIPAQDRDLWANRVKRFGALGLFALWWRFLKPPRNERRV